MLQQHQCGFFCLLSHLKHYLKNTVVLEIFGVVRSVSDNQICLCCLSRILKCFVTITFHNCNTRSNYRGKPNFRSSKMTGTVFAVAAPVLSADSLTSSLFRLSDPDVATLNTPRKQPSSSSFYRLAFNLVIKHPKVP